MDRTSVLRRLRHSHDIPNFVNLDRGRKEGDAAHPKSDRIFAARSTREKERRSHRSVSLPELETYAEDSQHDAWLIGHSREGDRFTLTASDENTTMLAEWGYGVPWQECRFPFDLVFEGVSYVGWRLEEPGGRLRWGAAFKPAEPGISWLNDTFLEWDKPGFRWALSYHQSTSPYSSRILLVEAKTIWVVERQRQAWKNILGEESLPVFDEAQTRRREFPLTLPENRDAFLREHNLPEKDSR